MAITRVQVAKRVSSPSAQVTNAWASTPTQGNLLIAFGYGSNSDTNASITGWTKAVAINWGATACIALFYKIAGAAEGSVVLDWTSSTVTSVVTMEWSGVDTLDKTAYTAHTGGTVTSRSSGTTAATTVADELCIAGFGTGNTTSAQSFSNSYTDEYSPDTVFEYLASLVVAATGAQETTMSWTTARFAGGLIATFYATPAAAGNPWYAWAQM